MNNTPNQNHATNLQLFCYENKEIRTVTINGDPWWVAKDVCDILGLSEVSKSVERLDDDEKSISFFDTLGGKQSLTTINESGLYALIIRSNKPEAFCKGAMRFTNCQTRAVGIPLKVISELLAMPLDYESPAIDDDKAIQISSISEPVTSSRGLKTIHLKIISRVDKPVKLVLDIV